MSLESRRILSECGQVKAIFLDIHANTYIVLFSRCILVCNISVKPQDADDNDVDWCGIWEAIERYGMQHMVWSAQEETLGSGHVHNICEPL